MRRALILGATGQDGHYLCRHLRGLDYEIVGTTHRAAGLSSGPAGVTMRQLDMLDTDAMRQLIRDVQPDEIYNLAARASSAQLFDDAVASGDVNGLSVVRLLQAMVDIDTPARLCQALSSEMFAGGRDSPQTEASPPRPRNAYGAAKAYAWHALQAYRIHHGTFACGAILYNHESPMRSPHHVTRKITQAVARIALHGGPPLRLGAADARRDWGHARDHVQALHLMLQMPKPDDFIVATGISHSVEDFCRMAFAHVGLDYHDHVTFDTPRPTSPASCELRGDAGKAHRSLGWHADTPLALLVAEMVEHDLTLMRSAAHDVAAPANAVESRLRP
jgi:GDPmannose 4,6-dehydratase